MQLQRNNNKRQRKKATTLSLSPSNLLSLPISVSPPLFASNLLLLHEKRAKKMSAAAEAPPRLSHTTSLSSEIKTVTTLHTITLFLLTTLLTNTDNSHKSHKHKPNETFPGALTFSPCFFLLLAVNGSAVVCGVVCRHFL
jgi:hypothetical protein